MEKTIKQMADEIQIDKQKVYRYIKKNHINEALQKNGVMYYDETVQSLVKREFLKKEPHQRSASNDAVYDVVLMQYEVVKKELEIKNKQIEELNKRLEECQNLLNQQQQLNALSEQKILMLEEKKHWWKFSKN